MNGRKPPITATPMTGLQVHRPDPAENPRAGRPRSAFPATPAVSLGGVAVGAKHTLHVQAEQLESITARIGRRLNHWLRTNPDRLPSPEFLETFRYHQASLLGLLREQRERAKLASVADTPIEQLEATFKHELVNALHTFTAEDWAIADRVRAEQLGTDVH